MVEHRLPKPGVAGSIPVSRSILYARSGLPPRQLSREGDSKFHTVHTVHKSMTNRSREAWRASPCERCEDRKRLK
jgi:hypothetical protein